MSKNQFTEFSNFTKAFYHVMQSRGYKLVEEPILLCQYYESLTLSQKRGVWVEVAKIIGKSPEFTAKHYINAYKRVLYNDALDEHKGDIDCIVVKALHEEHNKKEIVDLVKKYLSQYHIFPGAIESYVYQTILRTQGKRDLSFPAPRAHGLVFPDVKQKGQKAEIQLAPIQAKANLTKVLGADFPKDIADYESSSSSEGQKQSIQSLGKQALFYHSEVMSKPQKQNEIIENSKKFADNDNMALEILSQQIQQVFSAGNFPNMFSNDYKGF